MKELVSSVPVVIFSITSMMTQNSYRETGNISIDTGMGFGVKTSGYSLVLPPVRVNVEYILITFGAGSLSVGGYFCLGVD